MTTSNRPPKLPPSLLREAPRATGALIFTELFFHWGSFTLELVGFLALWAALSLAARGIWALVGSAPAGSPAERDLV